MTRGLPSDGPKAQGQAVATAPPRTRPSHRVAVVIADVLILDLDGVVYIGPDAVPHAIDALNTLAGQGIRLTAATNNASRPAPEVGDHLRRLGLRIADDDVMTSAQAAAAHLAAILPAGSSVLAIGGPGVSIALTEHGLIPLRASADLAAASAAADAADALLMGYGPQVAWFDLAAGQWAIDRGKPWVATNMDPTVPQPYGRAPGNGALVGLLQRSTGRDPVVIGKPQPTLFRAIEQRTGAARPLVIGDRLDTDVDGARAAGMRSVFVLTGVQSIHDLADRDPATWPDFIAQDLRALLGPIVTLERDAAGTARAADANVLTDAVIRIHAGLPVGPVTLPEAALPLIDLAPLRRDTVSP